MKPPKHDVDPSTRFAYKAQLQVTEVGNYELDPAHNVSTPQLSWEAKLKQTRVYLELIPDPGLYRM